MSNPSVHILQRAPVLEGLPHRVLEGLAGAGSPVSAPRRSVLPADPAGIYVLGTGRVRVERRGSERDVVLQYVGPGGLVGEAQLFESVERVRAVVTEDVEAVRIPPEALRSALEANGQLAVALVELAVRRRLDAEGRLVALLNRPVEARVVDFLLEAARSHGIPGPRGTLIGVKYTHQEIAGYVGSTRETVTVVLGDLRRAGLIEIDHRRVVVPDASALEARL